MTPQEQAESFIYRGLKGDIIIPQPMILRAIVDGGLFSKCGKSKITTQKTSMIYSCVDIPAAEIPLHFTEPWAIDTRPVRIPANGARILCSRPMFHSWWVSFELELDDCILSASLLRTIIDDAGKRVGIGAYRPGCKGPYGKFRVDAWKVERKPQLKTAA
jgi:hypothetical protein